MRFRLRLGDFAGQREDLLREVRDVAVGSGRGERDGELAAPASSGSRRTSGRTPASISLSHDRARSSRVSADASARA